MSADRLVTAIWRGQGAGAALARLALTPLEGLFRVGSVLRNKAYAAGLRRVHRAGVPVVSVGNLSVGGSGKTPIAAYIVALLMERGRKPAVVMRGYGDDERIVHSRLNPAAPVITAKNRSLGAQRAIREHGADVIVLDDAFQHRALHRDVDIVVFSADVPPDSMRLLPAGPWREPLAAVRRASLVIIARKAASDAQVTAARERIQSVAAGKPVAVASLRPSRLESIEGAVQDVSMLSGKIVLMLAAIADPAALSGQLFGLGADVRAMTFRDHHVFTSRDVESVVRAAKSCDLVVCTLKDVVKLESLWPRDAMPLWYVSQAVEVESGREILSDMLDSLFNK